MSYESAARQVKRQLELFLEDGKHNRIIVCLALLDEAEESVGPLDEYRGQ